jgi:ribonucleotide reductase beta subunit family protein with ferritin-like domain
MDAAGSAIRKIQLDEIKHFSMTNHIIKKLKEDPEWAKVVLDFEPSAIAMYQNARISDHAWADYLFPTDTALLPGINNSILKGYIDYNLDKVTNAVGIGTLIGNTIDTAPWAAKYTKSSNMQTANKEKDNSNYLLGKLDTAIPDNFWGTLCQI